MKKSLLNQSNAAFLLMLGFCLYWVWSFAGSFSVRSWYSPDGLARLFVTLPNCALFGLLFIVSHWNFTFVRRKWFAVLSGLTTAVGIVATTLYFNFNLFQALFVPGYVFTGLGSAMLIALWREAYGSLTAEMRKTSVSFAVVGAAFLYLLQATLPFGVAMAICSLAPIGASYFFWRVIARCGEGFDAVSEDVAKLNDQRFGRNDLQYGLVVLSCASLAAFQGVLRAMGYERPELGIWALVTSCAVLATSAIAIADIVVSRRRNWNYTMPLTTGAMLLVSFAALALQSGRAAEASSVCSFFLTTIYAYSLLPNLRARWTNPLRSFLLALFIVGGGESLGIVLGSVAPQITHASLLLVGLPFLLIATASIFLMLICAKNGKSGDAVVSPISTKNDGFVSESFPSDWGIEFETDVDDEQYQRREISDAVSEKCKVLSSEWALSDRESEILLKIALGRPYKVIANDLFISYNTIKTHVTHIYRKAGVHTRDELLAAIFDQKQMK